jgi:hypothetical protein
MSAVPLDAKSIAREVLNVIRECSCAMYVQRSEDPMLRDLFSYLDQAEAIAIRTIMRPEER